MIDAIRETDTPESPSSSSDDTDNQGNEAGGEDSDVQKETTTTPDITPDSSPPSYTVIEDSPSSHGPRPAYEEEQVPRTPPQPAPAPGVDYAAPTPGPSRDLRNGRRYLLSTPTPGRPGRGYHSRGARRKK